MALPRQTESSGDIAGLFFKMYECLKELQEKKTSILLKRSVQHFSSSCSFDVLFPPIIFRPWRDRSEFNVTLNFLLVYLLGLSFSCENPLFNYRGMENINPRVFSTNARCASAPLIDFEWSCVSAAQWNLRPNATYEFARCVEKNFQRYFHLYHVSYALEMYDPRSEFFSDKYHIFPREKFQKLDIEYQCRVNGNALVKLNVYSALTSSYRSPTPSYFYTFKGGKCLANWDLKGGN